MRNNPLAPTSGLFVVTSFELAEPWLFSQTEPYKIGYYRFQFRTDYFLELMKNMTWFFSFRTGFEKNLEVGVDNGSGVRIDPVTGEVVKGIPLIKQFALGGVGSLRGFQEQEINQRSLNIIGTLSYVNYRTQVDMPLLGSLRFGPFLDAGNVLADQMSFGNLRWGAGFGFHYLTPVGPVNLDWGFNLFPQPQDRGQNQFYLSIGVI
jgi:outer membrane translocation and assembly module TamA